MSMFSALTLQDQCSPDQISEAYASGAFNAWRPDSLHARIFEATQPSMSKEGADLMNMMEMKPRDTYLWRYLDLALKRKNGASYKWRTQYQKAGTCVGQCLKLCCDIGMAVQFLTRGQVFPGRAAVAGTYPGGRVDIAGQPGRWDGSNNSWTVEWLLKYGVLLLKDVNLADDSRDEDETLARNWCASRDGVPSQYETLAKQRPFKNGVRLKSAEEAAAALMAGAVVAQASSLIATGKRDSKGFSPVRRSGGHSQAVTGVRFDTFGFLQQNSWSDTWGSGGVYPADQPPGSVWITKDEMDAQIDSGDTYALFGVDGLRPPQQTHVMSL